MSRRGPRSTGERSTRKAAEIAARRRVLVGRELAELMDRPEPGAWADQGACRDRDPDLMFPDGDEGSPAFERQAEQARAVCGWCPVRAQCAAHAIAVGEPDGMWGGLSPDERREARRETTHAEGA